MKVTKISNAIPVKKFKGSLDMCDETEIGGWIIDEYGSNDPIEVNIFIDDEWVTRVTANIFRQDLLDAGIGNGQCAFYSRVPDKFFDGVEHSIEIKESLTSWVLTEPNRKFKIIANEISINVPELIDNRDIESQQYVNYKTTEILSIDLSSRITTILQSGLFNYLFYKQQTNLVLGIVEAIEHFLCTGAAQDLKPMPFFETEAYRQLNPDLSFLTNAQCFEHYVLKGRSEKRYYNRAMLRHDASKLRRSHEFDGLWYGSLIESIPAHLNCYEHYLAIGWRQNLQPNRQGFDSELYLACYIDAQQSNLPPFLHYLLHKKTYLSTTANINHFAHVISESGEFDSAFYQIQHQEPRNEKLSDILHYLYHGVELKLDPNSNFSTEYYVRKYPDILSSGMNPFAHYLADGRREGRVGQFDTQKYILPGKCLFDPDKPTVLVVCHEATKTGAPILGLRLVEQLSQQANVISWIGETLSLTEKETLRDDYSASSVATIEHFFDHIDTVWIIRALNNNFLLQVAILNSAATATVGSILYGEKVPTVALVHEYGDYMRHQISHILFAVNRIVVPAKSVKDSIDKIGVESLGFPRGHVAIRHQGRCLLPTATDGKKYSREDILLKLNIQEDEEMPAIVFGCGTVCIRKGVEYFVEAARLCKKRLSKPIRFVWVGSGYEPESDFFYSSWIKSQIVYSDLEKDIFIFEETIDLSPFFDLADVFFLSSRLDPFPNIAIDAVCSGCTRNCF